MFVMLPGVDGGEVAINPAHVRSVYLCKSERAGKYVRVCVGSDNTGWRIKGTVEEIVARLESATPALTLALNMMRCIGPDHEHRDPEWHTLCAQVRELAGQ